MICHSSNHVPLTAWQPSAKQCSSIIRQTRRCEFQKECSLKKCHFPSAERASFENGPNSDPHGFKKIFQKRICLDAKATHELFSTHSHHVEQLDSFEKTPTNGTESGLASSPKPFFLVGELISAKKPTSVHLQLVHPNHLNSLLETRKRLPFWEMALSFQKNVCECPHVLRCFYLSFIR